MSERMSDEEFEVLEADVFFGRPTAVNRLLTECRRARGAEDVKNALLVRTRDWLEDNDGDEWGDVLYLAIVDVVGEPPALAAPKGGER